MGHYLGKRLASKSRPSGRAVDGSLSPVWWPVDLSTPWVGPQALEGSSGLRLRIAAAIQRIGTCTQVTVDWSSRIACCFKCWHLLHRHVAGWCWLYGYAMQMTTHKTLYPFYRPKFWEDFRRFAKAQQFRWKSEELWYWGYYNEFVLILGPQRPQHKSIGHGCVVYRLHFYAFPSHCTERPWLRSCKVTSCAGGSRTSKLHLYSHWQRP